MINKNIIFLALVIYSHTAVSMDEQWQKHVDEQWQTYFLYAPVQLTSEEKLYFLRRQQIAASTYAQLNTRYTKQTTPKYHELHIASDHIPDTYYTNKHICDNLIAAINAPLGDQKKSIATLRSDIQTEKIKHYKAQDNKLSLCYQYYQDENNPRVSSWVFNEDQFNKKTEEFARIDADYDTALSLLSQIEQLNNAATTIQSLVRKRAAHKIVTTRRDDKVQAAALPTAEEKRAEKKRRHQAEKEEKERRKKEEDEALAKEKENKKRIDQLVKIATSHTNTAINEAVARTASIIPTKKPEIVVHQQLSEEPQTKNDNDLDVLQPALTDSAISTSSKSSAKNAAKARKRKTQSALVSTSPTSIIETSPKPQEVNPSSCPSLSEYANYTNWFNQRAQEKQILEQTKDKPTAHSEYLENHPEEMVINGLFRQYETALFQILENFSNDSYDIYLEKISYINNRFEETEKALIEENGQKLHWYLAAHPELNQRFHTIIKQMQDIADSTEQKLKQETKSFQASTSEDANYEQICIARIVKLSSLNCKQISINTQLQKFHTNGGYLDTSGLKNLNVMNVHVQQETVSSKTLPKAEQETNKRNQTKKYTILEDLYRSYPTTFLYSNYINWLTLRQKEMSQLERSIAKKYDKKHLATNRLQINTETKKAFYEKNPNETTNRNILETYIKMLIEISNDTSIDITAIDDAQEEIQLFELRLLRNENSLRFYIADSPDLYTRLKKAIEILESKKDTIAPKIIEIVKSFNSDGGCLDISQLLNPGSISLDTKGTIPFDTLYETEQRIKAHLQSDKVSTETTVFDKVIPIISKLLDPADPDSSTSTAQMMLKSASQVATVPKLNVSLESLSYIQGYIYTILQKTNQYASAPETEDEIADKVKIYMSILKACINT